MRVFVLCGVARAAIVATLVGGSIETGTLPQASSGSVIDRQEKDQSSPLSLRRYRQKKGLG